MIQDKKAIGFAPKQGINQNIILKEKTPITVGEASTETNTEKITLSNEELKSVEEQLKQVTAEIAALEAKEKEQPAETQPKEGGLFSKIKNFVSDNADNLGLGLAVMGANHIFGGIKGLRFHKELKVTDSTRINLSKSGPSLSVGKKKKGLGVNVSKKGVKGTVSLPGTGLSFSKKLIKGLF